MFNSFGKPWEAEITFKKKTQTGFNHINKEQMSREANNQLSIGAENRKGLDFSAASQRCTLQAEMNWIWTMWGQEAWCRGGLPDKSKGTQKNLFLCLLTCTLCWYRKSHTNTIMCNNDSFFIILESQFFPIFSSVQAWVENLIWFLYNV